MKKKLLTLMLSCCMVGSVTMPAVTSSAFAETQPGVTAGEEVALKTAPAVTTVEMDEKDVKFTEIKKYSDDVNWDAYAKAIAEGNETPQEGKEPLVVIKVNGNEYMSYTESHSENNRKLTW